MGGKIVTDSGETHPILGAYWVRPGQLRAGPYPAGWDERATRQRLGKLLDAGATTFVDLTESDELAAYVLLLNTEAGLRGRHVAHVRMPIRDMDVPTDEHMVAILDTLDDALTDGETTYVHCLGGIGRTGTVVGCYLVRHGLDPEDALATITRLRGGLQDSPQTPAQFAMVRRWRAGA
jgi:protein-tyrosine phosphatase